MPEARKLNVFLCHASQDKPAVRDLYTRLKSEAWIAPWLDEEELLPGMDWDLEIYKAIRDADAILVCLSNESVSKEGYVQREFKRALSLAEEKPDGTIYVIPLRLDDCTPPRRFQQWQWLDYFAANAHEKLLKSLRLRADTLKLEAPVSAPPLAPAPGIHEDLDLYRFIQIPESEEVPYPFWIGKYPVTNAQYERFLNAPDYAEKIYWTGFQKFNADYIRIGRWENDGWEWLQENIKDDQPVLPNYWDDENLGSANPENPVVGVTWYEANAYGNWLTRYWSKLAENRANSDLQPRLMRLPLEFEWVAAAGGATPSRRYPWDTPGKGTKDEKEIVLHANVYESGIGHTTPVDAYLRSGSPHGVMDMAGNVWEWMANYLNMREYKLALRGGSWLYNLNIATVDSRFLSTPDLRGSNFGMRLVAFSR